MSLTSIGTLFAFVLVCGVIIVLQQRKDKPESKFKVPYINAQYIYPAMLFASIFLIQYNEPAHFTEDIWTKDTWPMAVFWLIALVMAFYSFTRKLSLLPVLGLISCLYLMAQETHKVWMRFLIWLAIGLVIYFLYSYRNSKLARAKA